MCLAQGHNAATLVRLEPSVPRSWVKHSTTEPLHFTCEALWVDVVRVNGAPHSDYLRPNTQNLSTMQHAYHSILRYFLDWFC